VLYLVRHGRTAANASSLLQGTLDLSLDDTGRAQIAALPGMIGAVDRVISSPLLRAQETAAVFGLPVELDDRWRELDYGAFDGRKMTDISPEMWATWRSDADFAPGGGETLRQVGARVWAACDELAESISARNTVVVSHVTPVKLAAAWALGADLLMSWRCFLDQASVCRIDNFNGRPVLAGWNQRP
jgi:alpha-ribazole phosphatase